MSTKCVFGTEPGARTCVQDFGGGPVRATGGRLGGAFDIMTLHSGRNLCPGGVCPGLGNAFFLPDVDLLYNRGPSNIMNGFKILSNRAVTKSPASSVSVCGDTQPKTQQVNKMTSSLDAESFAASVVGKVTVESPGLPIPGVGKLLSVLFGAKASMSLGAGFNYSSDSSLQTSTWDSNSPVGSVLLEVSETQPGCYTPDNITPAFAAYLATLDPAAPLDAVDITHDPRWEAYTRFLRVVGSHVLVAMDVGALLQITQSQKSASQADMENLQLKVQYQAGKKWGIAKANFDTDIETERAAKASLSDTLTQTNILGGDPAKRNKFIGGNFDVHDVDAFLNSSGDSDSFYNPKFRALWAVLPVLLQRSPTALAVAKRLEVAYTAMALHYTTSCNPLTCPTLYDDLGVNVLQGCARSAQPALSFKDTDGTTTITIFGSECAKQAGCRPGSCAGNRICNNGACMPPDAPPAATGSVPIALADRDGKCGALQEACWTLGNDPKHTKACYTACNPLQGQLPTTLQPCDQYTVTSGATPAGRQCCTLPSMTGSWSRLQPFMGVEAPAGKTCAELHPDYVPVTFPNTIDSQALGSCSSGACPVGQQACWEVGMGSGDMCKCFQTLYTYNERTNSPEAVCPRWGSNPERQDGDGWWAEKSNPACDGNHDAPPGKFCCTVTGKSSTDNDSYNGMAVDASKLALDANGDITCHNVTPYQSNVSTVNNYDDPSAPLRKHLYYNAVTNRPKASGTFPNMKCDSPLYKVATVNRYVDSNNSQYYKCMSETEFKTNTEKRERVDFNASTSHKRGMWAQWCDNGTNCGTGAWCCRDGENSAKQSFSGRCVYCNNSSGVACGGSASTVCGYTKDNKCDNDGCDSSMVNNKSMIKW